MPGFALPGPLQSGPPIEWAIRPDASPWSIPAPPIPAYNSRDEVQPAAGSSRDHGGDLRLRRQAHVPHRRCIVPETNHVLTPFRRPQVNGKVERFNRTLLEEWAYVRLYRTNAARDRALQPWVHRYNHHRTHTALGGRPPVSRVNNLPGYYI